MSDKHKEDEKYARDEARARVLETAERAGRHVNENKDLSDEFVKAQNAAQEAGLLSLKDRVGLLEKAMLKPLEKNWKHPIGAVVYGKYHRCTACGGKLGDEVVLVTERLRSGDKHFVFCNTTCLMNYDGWL